jgi:hypothetical protein
MGLINFKTEEYLRILPNYYPEGIVMVEVYPTAESRNLEKQWFKKTTEFLKHLYTVKNDIFTTLSRSLDAMQIFLHESQLSEDTKTLLKNNVMLKQIYKDYRDLSLELERLEYVLSTKDLELQNFPLIQQMGADFFEKEPNEIIPILLNSFPKKQRMNIRISVLGEEALAKEAYEKLKENNTYYVNA